MHSVNDFFSGVRWIAVVNTSNEQIHAFAVMAVTGVAATGELQVGKPTADGMSGCLINGPEYIPAPVGGVQAVGKAIGNQPYFAIYNNADGVPAPGDSWGSVKGQWYLGKSRNGFLIYGLPENGRVLVTPSCCGPADAKPAALPCVVRDMNGNITDLQIRNADGSVVAYKDCPT